MNKFYRTASFLNQNAYKLALGVALTTAAASASAAIDVSAAVSVLTDGIQACVAIGVIMLSVWATKTVYKMIKS